MKDTDLKAIVGLGDTGLACARFLSQQGIPFIVTDSRDTPPQLQTLTKEYPDVEVVCGQFDEKVLNKASEIIISPGVSLKEPTIAAQISKGKPIIGDIELFARYVNKPVLAITGSNGKTTVTTLVGLMLKEAGVSVAVCGNIGIPVLEQLTTDVNYYVVELSSFQLETTYSLKPMTATVLNVSPDHMDRYAEYSDYVHAKQRIYNNCQYPVVNADQPMIWQDLKFNCPALKFSLTQEKKIDFALTRSDNETYLTYKQQPLIATSELRLNAPHHLQNALAALAIGHSVHLPTEKMLNVLRHFEGIPHRCQWVRRYNHVDWYNDSKGTNVGATKTAILSLGQHARGNLILIAGGQGKGADFSLLQEPVKKYVKHTILIGEDATLLAAALKGVTQISHAVSMAQAVELAASLVQPNDFVLLSPACASFDMFDNFEHRGEVFMKIVNAL